MYKWERESGAGLGARECRSLFPRDNGTRNGDAGGIRRVFRFLSLNWAALYTRAEIGGDNELSRSRAVSARSASEQRAEERNRFPSSATRRRLLPHSNIPPLVIKFKADKMEKKTRSRVAPR